jgi:tetratricopeptide (TPR) repeat protein
LARRKEPARLAVIGTYRVGEVRMRQHALATVIDELRAHGACKEMAVGGLAESAVLAYLSQRFPCHELPPGLASFIHGSTEGNPLYMVAVVDSLVHDHLLVLSEDRWRLHTTVAELVPKVPESLHGLIDGAIDRMSEEERRVLEASSAVGLEFSTSAVAAALLSTPEDVETVCERLARRTGFLRRIDVETWPDGTCHCRYAMAHAMHRQVLLDRTPAARLRVWHRRVGERLEAAYPGSTERIAAELAVHFESGGVSERAVHYHGVAARRATQRGARTEALAHFERSLATLRELPGGAERDERELELLAGLGGVLIAARGYASPEVDSTYTRAMELARSARASSRLCPVLYGAYLSSVMQMRFDRAEEVSRQLERIGLDENNDGLVALALTARATPFLSRGEWLEARALLERALRLFDPERDRALAAFTSSHPVIAAHVQLGFVLFPLGYPDGALEAGRRAMRMAEESANPLFRVSAFAWLARIHKLRRESAAAQHLAEQSLAIEDEHSFPFWRADARLIRGWAMTMQGVDAGPAEMEEGLRLRIAAATISRSAQFVVAAEAYLHAHDVERGLDAVEKALDIAATTEEAAFEGEALRLRAELLHLARRRADEAQHAAARALAIAQRQGAKTYELRAAMTLCRVGAARGPVDQPLRLLAGLVDRFEEGRDLPDLVEARTLCGRSGGGHLAWCDSRVQLRGGRA